MASIFTQEYIVKKILDHLTADDLGNLNQIYPEVVRRYLDGKFGDYCQLYQKYSKVNTELKTVCRMYGLERCSGCDRMRSSSQYLSHSMFSSQTIFQIYLRCLGKDCRKFDRPTGYRLTAFCEFCYYGTEYVHKCLTDCFAPRLPIQPDCDRILYYGDGHRVCICRECYLDDHCPFCDDPVPLKDLSEHLLENCPDGSAYLKKIFR